MILLLGASNYIGQAFARVLRIRGLPFVPLTQSGFDYSRFEFLMDYIRHLNPEFLINATTTSAEPDSDEVILGRQEAIQINTVLPQTVARTCQLTRTPWAHLSSSCIYSGAKVFENGVMRVERDCTRPDLRAFFKNFPERVFGFTELDEPNFTFQSPPCSVHAGTKALGEDSLRDSKDTYVWRLGVPFNGQDEPDNFLSKVQWRPGISDNMISLAHVDESVQACLDLWDKRASFGVYNIANPGVATTREIVAMFQRIRKRDSQFDFSPDDGECGDQGTVAPRSHCILDVSKLLATGVRMRPVQEALEDSLRRWQAAPAGPDLAGRKQIRRSPLQRRKIDHRLAPPLAARRLTKT